MSQVGRAEWGGAIFGLLLGVWFFGDISFRPKSVRVTERICNQAWGETGECGGKLTVGSDLYFILNSSARAAELIVKRNVDGFGWAVHSRIYRDCAIVDDENWECVETTAPGVSAFMGMSDGEYYRRSQDPYGYDIRGVSGWRYWWDKVSEPSAD